MKVDITLNKETETETETRTTTTTTTTKNNNNNNNNNNYNNNNNLSLSLFLALFSISPLHHTYSFSLPLSPTARFLSSYYLFIIFYIFCFSIPFFTKVSNLVDRPTLC